MREECILELEEGNDHDNSNKRLSLSFGSCGRRMSHVVPSIDLTVM